MNPINPPLPIKNLVSFHKVFESLEQMSQDDDENLSRYAKNLIEEMEDFPELRDGFDDFSLFEKYKVQIEKLTRLLFPDALLTNEIKAISPPFMFAPFKKSTRFENILANAPDGFDIELKFFDEDLYYIMGCAAILQAYYKYPVSVNLPLIIEIPNKLTQQIRYYRIAFNADLSEFSPNENAIDISDEDFQLLSNNFEDIDLWKKMFPEKSWVMKGLGVMNLMDVTLDQSIAQFTKNLLYKENNTIDKLENNLQSLLGINDLKLGFTAYADFSFFQTAKNEYKSFALGDQISSKCKNIVCDTSFQQLIVDKQPLVISNVEKYSNEIGSSLSQHLMAKGVKSYIIYPIVDKEEIISFLELVTYKANELTSFSIQKLRDVLPIISVATARFKSESTNRVEAVIQKQCTTIHSSVKWKFLEEAKKYIEDEDNGKYPVFDDFVFRDVYPLYGQMDIKNSSENRNNSVSSDLIAQLDMVIAILEKVYEYQQLPTIEELNIRTHSYIKEVKTGLLAGSEYKIMSFLGTEIYPLFDLLKEATPSISESIASYKAALDASVGALYDERKKWDNSVHTANQMMADFIDEKQLEAQNMFPHYFERYKTDGLEYNIYIGGSIAQNKDFNPLYLKNLRLWQITMMCEMERSFRELQPKLDTYIEVATLILAYNTPLSINFRMDEKRFDVDGAYNARYEIVKKRVDKAHIKGTNERITQPNYITIIYTNDDDRVEYKKYITYLEAKGYLVKNSLEKHDLEDLQGITGLKALRVEVNYD